MDTSSPPPPRDDTQVNGVPATTPPSRSPLARDDEPDNVERERKRDDEEGDDGLRPACGSDVSLPQILREVDSFLRRGAPFGGESSSGYAEAPMTIELLCERVESAIGRYSSGSRLGCDPDDEACLFDSISRLSRLTNKLESASSKESSQGVQVLSRTSSVLQRAMLFLEDELRWSLDRQLRTNNELESKSIKAKPSFNLVCEPDRCLLEPNSEEDELLPVFSPEMVSRMNRICSSMIEAGYETECCIVYSVSRRNVFKSALTKLGLENMNMDDVQRMPWESLEGEIRTWISVIKQCATDLFPAERNLCESVFSSSPQISRSLFSNLVRSVAIQLLNFAEAVVLTRRAAEKLFKFLDMYETLRDLVSSFDESYDPDAAGEVRAEILAAKTRMAEAVVKIFCDLENSIKSDNGRTPVPSGAVHPLIRYTMNYLKYAYEYKETLEQVFREHQDGSSNDNNENESTSSDHKEAKFKVANGDGESSPFDKELLTVMDLLDANLDMKSKLYRDPALHYIFLMNNGRYILQKIKSSPEIHKMMGDTWCRKRSSDLRHYHKSYQRETLSRLLQCLSHEGLMVSGKVSKQALKEKFKTFNAMFDEIHKTQSMWVVNDEQMQSELRVSVAAVVTPAYRSFLGRFSQYLDSGRQSEKYIKYQPEDIEGLIEDLFDGNALSMARRKT
ncbi:hypothetical protein MLD38_003362 [Melastoma candidum]|uniref:Uncharacterized protein n=1 Tax=Melastoma candidum TaxID=119954 RepID=A0ACB9S3P5_9MYRT|nr:hypothetical protein MLD38_003362 [Melastoma candidum]